MKLFILVLLITIPRLLLSQEFKSSVTAHPPMPYQLEFIEREIKIDQEKLTIISKGEIVTDIQEFNILSKKKLEFSKVARVILYERLANTNFKGVILPVVSPRKMLETKIKL